MKSRGTLGILTNDPAQVFQSNVIAGAAEIAGQRGYDAHVRAAEQVADAARFPFHPRELAGLLVIANVASDDVLLALQAQGIPLSLVSHYVAGTTIPSVIPDNARGIAQLVAHVVEACGRRKPVFIQGHMGQNDGVSRDHAFRQALIRHDLSIADEMVLQGEFIPAKAAQSLARLVETGRDFDAVIASDYLMAVAALDVLQAAGIAVPEQVCVAGFGDGVEAAAAGVTTVAADVVELGRRACRQLIGQVEGLAIRGITVLSTELIHRKTSAPRS